MLFHASDVCKREFTYIYIPVKRNTASSKVTEIFLEARD